MTDPVRVRRVRPDEWEAFRDLRLRALADSPHAFSTTVTEATTRSDAEWQEWAARCAGDAWWASFVAERDGALVGMATGWFPEERLHQLDEPGIPTVIQMWVAPDERRRGVGGRLVSAVLAWMKERGSPLARLTVNAADLGAIAFYEGLGFRKTGRTEPLRDTSAIEMERRTATDLSGVPPS